MNTQQFDDWKYGTFRGAIILSFLVLVSCKNTTLPAPRVCIGGKSVTAGTFKIAVIGTASNYFRWILYDPICENRMYDVLSDDRVLNDFISATKNIKTRSFNDLNYVNAVMQIRVFNSEGKIFSKIERVESIKPYRGEYPPLTFKPQKDS
ncbi:hypothetical protein ACOYW6_12830 [Parablastomonas sp. CN1-191]|uniref:hypothetical protein n=1 Tax=Parablastomonas sp. CN1-191 TaxID=3400908 RepID=UPI003BF7A054